MAGVVEGYNWALEDLEVTVEPYEPPNHPLLVFEDFDALDAIAAQVRPDLPQAERWRWVWLFLRASYRYRVDPFLVLSVAITESGLRHNVVSPKGAVGVMQLMPIVARQYGIDPYDLEQNIDTGVRYLAELLHRYRNNLTLALAAYNAGPSRVRRTVPAIRETRNYVRKVQNLYTSLPTGGGRW